jgi:hypothetical protein
MRKILAFVAAVSALALLSIPVAADSGTGPPPFPTCHPFIPANAFGPGQPPVNLPSTGPCQETGHFGLSVFVPMPGGPCPPPVPGPVVVVGQGNGIFHSNVNAADDWWATSTFEGSADVHVLLGFDSNGPIPGALLASGHQMQWFGNSLNANNFVLHDTGNVTVTTVATPAQTFDFHFADHFSSTGGNPLNFGLPPFLQARTVFMKASC